MNTYFTRRRDLFLDAGFPAPDRALAAMSEELRRLASASDWSAAGPVLRQALAARLSRVPAAQLRLARLAPDWIDERGGDLATALWLARCEHGEALDLGGFLLGLFVALLDTPGRERDAIAFARYVFDLHYDWDRVHADSGGANGNGHGHANGNGNGNGNGKRLTPELLREREPNALVWRLLEELGRSGDRLHVLELGCGVGNDAWGLLGSERVGAYVGVDDSHEALEAFARRAKRQRFPCEPVLLCAEVQGLLQRPPPQLERTNVVYTYSALHSLHSEDLLELFKSVRALLARPGAPRGHFAFALKAAGSLGEGQGLPVYRPDVWVNWDGLSRWFPSRDALARQLERAGLELLFHELRDHWSLSERGKRDVFHHVLCAPRGG